jgi:class 3 adenylate cyclase
LDLQCRQCGASNEPDEHYCGQCGSALAVGRESAAAERQTAPAVRVVSENSDAQPLDSERKTVAALFADIKGSMELMEDLDPEEARAIIDPALNLMIEAVHRYDGYVGQSTGDGIFAIFGAPLAHEDHANRALYAALGVIGVHTFHSVNKGGGGPSFNLQRIAPAYPAGASGSGEQLYSVGVRVHLLDVLVRQQA